jgi:TRAP-type C4-dicarboxylate transport system substrate-binding protein
MKKKIWIALGIPVVLGLLFGSFSFSHATSDSAKPGKIITWKWSSVSAPGYAGDKAATWLINEVNKRTHDKIKLELYSGNALGFGATGQLDALNKNLTQMAYLPFPHIEGQQPELAGLDLPRLIPADDWGLRPKLTTATLPLINSILKKHNVIVLSWLPDAARQLATRKPVNSLSDVRKMKLRAMNAMESDVFAKLGISSTAMSPSEVYTALQQGVIDGAGCPYLYIYLQKWPEVAPNVFNWSLNTASVSVAVSKKAYDALPKEMQKAIMDLQPELVIKMRDLFKADDDIAKDKLITAKSIFTELSKPDAAAINSIMLPMWTDWYKKTSPEGKALFQKAVEVMTAAGYDRSVPE